jgi:hypothetical protein
MVSKKDASKYIGSGSDLTVEEVKKLNESIKQLRQSTHL